MYRTLKKLNISRKKVFVLLNRREKMLKKKATSIENG